MTHPNKSAKENTEHIDAAVIGAGFAGLYAVYKLRELGLPLRAFEKGKDVGGTNRQSPEH